ncbi:MAG: hypothetical protein H8E61_11330 [Bacteroidetes bacterium]|nr:hypothetical protein [Bacteroidota bacterium]
MQRSTSPPDRQRLPTSTSSRRESERHSGPGVGLKVHPIQPPKCRSLENQ